MAENDRIEKLEAAIAMRIEFILAQAKAAFGLVRIDGSAQLLTLFQGGE